ncbi:MAG: peptide chain release factor N(5)-glutamine methyltransferase [Solirubrobacteraceae bacterium]
MAEALLARRGPVGLALATGRDRLAVAGCDTPLLDAELLLANALEVGRERLVIDRHEMLPESAWTRFAALLARRAAREPVAYILGRREFRRITLAVDRRVLIPRPETELLVEVGLALPPGALVADVGTGSGAVALALKDERPDLIVRGLDLDPGALDVARENAAALGLEVQFARADLLDGGRYDAVLANLPYVPDGTELAPELSRYEPARALFAGPDGLAVIRRLVGLVASRIAGERRPALLALEIGDGEQASAVSALIRDAGFGAVEVMPDLAGCERVVIGSQ